MIRVGVVATRRETMRRKYYDIRKKFSTFAKIRLVQKMLNFYNMKMKLIAVMLVAICATSALQAQTLPRKVSNVEVLNLDGKAVKLPHWGEKNLMIFYVGPDHHKQNNDFTVDLEKNHRAERKNLYGFGVMNLKDAPMVPNGMARSMAKKRTESNHAVVLADQNRVLSTAWWLGDCNNQ